MIQSIIRELIRFQDLLATMPISDELWHKWAEANEEVIAELQKESKE